MSEIKGNLQVLPVTSKVFFPYSHIKAKFQIESANAYKLGSYLGLVFSIPAQDNAAYRSIRIKDNYTEIGVVVKVESSQSFMFNTNGIYSEAIVISGFLVSRFQVLQYKSMGKPMNAEVNLLSDENSENMNKTKIIPKLLELFKSGIVDKSILSLLENEKDFQKFSFQLGESLDLTSVQKMLILQESNLEKRYELLYEYLRDFSTRLGFERKLDLHLTKKLTNVNSPANSLFKEIINNNQTIFKTQNKNKSKGDQLLDTLQNSKMPDEIKNELLESLQNLNSNPTGGSHEMITKNHIETVVKLPWSESVFEKNDIIAAEAILERDHFGLEKVKKRIIEFLAVKFMKGNSKGSIICLQGPPGVGKTSLGKSIAEALGRPFARVSLGGVKDEAEVRGHRRTYVGAYPGIIIQSLIQAEKDNPVILLDEIDKLTRGHSGDPSSALLEVLDSAQNSKFKDHYIGYPFDLSKILFIATANSLETIQRPLLDRMEVIKIPGYTLEEKVQIGLRYLVPRQVEDNGIEDIKIEFQPAIIKTIIKGYTSEPGVRELERSIGAICRGVCLEYSKHKAKYPNKTFSTITVDESLIKKTLGYERNEENGFGPILFPGISYGLAVTPAGGKVLIVESSLSIGKGEIQITGQLGDIMKESVLTALAWIKSNEKRINFSFPEMETLDRKKNLFEQIDINIHFPAASIPKDGPSAGITILSALVSLLSNVNVRSDVSMTGEISLQGRVLPIGGLKDKALASLAVNIKRIIVPEANKNDVLEIAPEVLKDLKFIFVKTADDVLESCLEFPDKVLTRQWKLKKGNL